MSFPAFGAILFDLDGVLVDSEVLANQVWIAVLAQHNLHLSPHAFMKGSIGQTLTGVFDWLHAEHGWAKPDSFESRLDEQLLQAFETVRALAGAEHTLRSLQAAGMPTAIVSNSQRDRLHLKLRAAGLNDLTNGHVYDPEHTEGRGKPFPDLYLLAAQQLGVPATRCLVVEDSVPGVQAGLAAGATVWGLCAGEHMHAGSASELSDAGAARLLHSHGELQQALAALGNGSEEQLKMR
ncbi:HAD family phosphatase [Deinococcus deserti]|uniref:Putative phosphatase n=1 Tax=Deinococcus deserti (strain DSM 17065 / CIP 109153 / LMG 22923 / VCD115) TaxID=546414 RepID=C1D2F0_DEIDV|nr:HAD family phosphatase [Deinococcus deserti]ACO47589.1 putative phosphatase [Deinococcus deserti VCD115]